MRARSWMAALALIGASSILIGRGISAQGTGTAGDAPQAKGTKTTQAAATAGTSTSDKSPPRNEGEKKAPSSPNLPAVRLDLLIAGLSSEGCDVEVKPANPSCKFRPITARHVTGDGHASIDLRDVELRGADRTCSLAITVREPGQPPQTIYRGFRIRSAKSGAVPKLTCCISSQLAGVETHSTKK